MGMCGNRYIHDSIAVMCLTEYPKIEGANMSYVGWDGNYPAPKGATVVFTCKENSEGFTDGFREHTATCSAKDPDTWCTAASFDHVRCELPGCPIRFSFLSVTASSRTSDSLRISQWTLTTS